MVAAKQPGATTATNQDILMRKFQPSLVDWDKIATRLMAGEPTARVAQDYEISRQAIAKRAKREGWLESQVVMQSARKNAEQNGTTGRRHKSCSTRRRAPTTTSGTYLNRAKKRKTVTTKTQSCRTTIHSSKRWSPTSKTELQGERRTGKR